MSKEEFTGFTNLMSQGPPVSGDLILGAGGFSTTNNQSSYQDSLLSGNNDGTIPLSQGHALSNCKIANMDKKNPDPICLKKNLQVLQSQCHKDLLCLVI
jgi:hypothetical protein